MKRVLAENEAPVVRRDAWIHRDRDGAGPDRAEKRLDPGIAVGQLDRDPLAAGDATLPPCGSGARCGGAQRLLAHLLGAAGDGDTMRVAALEQNFRRIHGHGVISAGAPASRASSRTRRWARTAAT
jgi:hypothetical protein